MANNTDVFLSHNWGKDKEGRNNHYRVSLINRKLIELGYETWFDEQKLYGDFDDQISEGIEKTKCVVVFMTELYRNKVNSDNPRDYCKLEFSHAKIKKTTKKMVAIVMEPCMADISKWIGQVSMNLAGNLYIDMSEDLLNETYLNERMKKLQEVLQSKGIQPTNMKNKELQSGLFFLFY